MATTTNMVPVGPATAAPNTTTGNTGNTAVDPDAAMARKAGIYKLCIIGIFFVAFCVNAFASISLPWLATSSTCIAETNFNQHAFNGTMNGIEVLSLSNIRLGIWSACYSDMYHSIASHTCLPSKLGYEIILTEGNNSHIVAQPILTGLLIFQLFAAFFTLLATFWPFFGYNNWSPFAALASTVLTIIAYSGIILTVGNVMQAYGEGVTTHPGSGFGFIFVPIVFIIVGWVTQCCAINMTKKHQKEKKKKAHQDMIKEHYKNAHFVKTKFDVPNPHL